VERLYLGVCSADSSTVMMGDLIGSHCSRCYKMMPHRKWKQIVPQEICITRILVPIICMK